MLLKHIPSHQAKTLSLKLNQWNSCLTDPAVYCTQFKKYDIKVTVRFQKESALKFCCCCWFLYSEAVIWESCMTEVSQLQAQEDLGWLWNTTLTSQLSSLGFSGLDGSSEVLFIRVIAICAVLINISVQVIFDMVKSSKNII